MDGSMMPGGAGCGASLELVRLMLASFDELAEIDLSAHGVRVLRRAEGKYSEPAAEFVHPEDREAYIAFNDLDTMKERLAASETPGVLRTQYRRALADGSWRRVEQAVAGDEAQGLPDGLCYSFVFDLEQSACAPGEAETREDEQRSTLTGLIWEEAFFSRGRELVRSSPEDWCMIAIDIEHFKLFNEWYGRKQGDILLAEIGERLKSAAEETGGLACYYGQDDFVLLVPNNREWINRLYDDLHALVIGHGASVGFMPALGVTPMAAGDPIEDVYDRAALASHRAKESCRDRVCTYDPAIFRQTEREYQILSDFQQALEDHELFIMLQPQCVVSTGRVVGAESLVRWRREDGEMVPPGVFVPVLEEYGFVTELDKFVWEEVCAWQRRWIDSGHTLLPVSVNVSQIDIFTIDVPEFLEQLLCRYSLAPEAVKVEITESAYVDNDSVVDAVRRLRDKGFLVLMDDFGSGYSSLNMLRNINVDVIKLDAQFLRMNKGDRKGIQIIESIVNMAKTMGMPIIVEGVETRDETEFLSSLGCNYVQGYYFFRPMPAREYEKLIADPEKIDTAGFRFKAKNQFRAREFLDENLFSDAMLNNILGPVAFVSRSGSKVDIMRGNRQFFETVGKRGTGSETKGIEQLIPPESRRLLLELLDAAEEEPLSGAAGILPFLGLHGERMRFELHVYFVEEDESGEKFYISARSLGAMRSLKDRMRLLYESAADSVALVRQSGEGWSFRVLLHGLENELGLDRETLERELSDGSFLKRAAPGTGDMLLGLAERTRTLAGETKGEASARLEVKTEDGRVIGLLVCCVRMRDRAGNDEYALLMRKA